MQFVIDRMSEAPQILKDIKLEQRWVAHVVGDQVHWWPSEWVSRLQASKTCLSIQLFLATCPAP